MLHLTVAKIERRTCALKTAAEDKREWKMITLYFTTPHCKYVNTVIKILFKIYEQV